MHFGPFWIAREGPRNNFHQRSAIDISPIVNFHKVAIYWHFGYQPICTPFTLFTMLHFKYIQVYSL